MKKVPVIDRVVYLLSTLASLGATYVIKTIIVNAIAEVDNANKNAS